MIFILVESLMCISCQSYEVKLYLIFLMNLSFTVFFQGKRDWHVSSFHGAWVKGVTAGGCGAPPNQGNVCMTEPLVLMKLI